MTRSKGKDYYRMIYGPQRYPYLPKEILDAVTRRAAKSKKEVKK